MRTTYVYTDLHYTHWISKDKVVYLHILKIKKSNMGLITGFVVIKAIDIIIKNKIESQ